MTITAISQGSTALILALIPIYRKPEDFHAMEYKGTDRRRTDRRADSRADWDLWRDAVNERLAEASSRMERLEQSLYPRIQKIDEMHSDFSALKGGFTVLTWVGKAAKPLFLIGTFLTAVVLGIKTGVWKFP